MTEAYTAAPRRATALHGGGVTSAGEVIGLRVVVDVEDGPIKTIRGRCAWALDRLVAAGETGCTPLSNPAPRWADYVFKLRHHMIHVETVDEVHGGAFPGRHARYVLRSRVRVIERQVREAAGAAA